MLPASIFCENLRKKALSLRAPWQGFCVEQHLFSCYACGHTAETSGPFPFMLDENNYRQPYPSPAPRLHNGRERGFDGLYAQMYCPLCDKPTSALISQFYRPATQEDLDAGQVDSMEVDDPSCQHCGNKRLLYAEGAAPCPSCQRGQMVLPDAAANPVWQDQKGDSHQPQDFISKKSEAATSLRTYLTIAWIPLTLLAAFVSLAAITGSVSACNDPGPGLRGFCSGPWQWLSVLAGFGPIVFMLLGGYIALNDERKRLWPFAFAFITAILFAALAWLR